MSSVASPKMTNDPRLAVLRQQLAVVREYAPKRPLRDDDFAPLLSCLADPQTLEVLSDAYLECLRSIARHAPVNTVLHLAKYLCDYVASTSARLIATNAKNIVQFFHTIFDEFHQRATALREEETLVLLVNTIFAKLVDSIKPDNVVVVTTVLGLMQRFSSVPALQSKLQAMFHCKDYFCFELLGSGQFSDVYKGCHKVAGKLVAVKKMKYLNVSETIQKALKREVQVMKNMNSPAIIKLYDSFQIDQYLFIVMEYSPLGDLETHIKKRSNGFGIDEVAHFMTELAVGLRVLRSKSIVHRDLKPANILLFPDPLAPFGIKLKLCDFTMARELVAGDLAKTLCGSPLYMAPEVLNRQKYTDKADLWSVGVIMYRLLFLRLPYTGVDEWDLRENINSKQLDIPHDIPDDARDLLCGLLQKDPLLRLSWDEFFTHAFLSREVLNEVPVEDPLQQINDLQSRLKDYSEKLTKANLTVAKLQKELEEARHREAILKQMHEEERQKTERRLKELEEQLVEVRAKYEARLRSEGLAGSDIMEVSSGSGIQSDSTTTTVSGGNQELSVVLGELAQYKQLLEAALEENNRLMTQLRECAVTEQLLRNELQRKEEKVKELQHMEGVFQEQMCDLEAELQAKDERIQVLEDRFKELESYRLQLQQQAQAMQQANSFPMFAPNEGAGQLPAPSYFP